jgi:hypothetical protein
MPRNRVLIGLAAIAVLASAGPVGAAAASKFILGGFNASTSTTSIQSSSGGSVLALQNSNASGTGLSVTVPAGQAPITVNSDAGTATNLDADTVDGDHASDFIRGPVEAWHLVGTSGEPGWGRPTLTSIDPFLPAGFLKDPFGFVHLQGHVLAAYDEPDGCDTYALFTLPAGYRPAGQVTEPAISGIGDVASLNAPAQIDIFANGNIEICFPRLQEYGWVTLDGMTFQAAP